MNKIRLFLLLVLGVLKELTIEKKKKKKLVSAKQAIGEKKYVRDEVSLGGALGLDGRSGGSSLLSAGSKDNAGGEGGEGSNGELIMEVSLVVRELLQLAGDAPDGA